MAGVPIYAIALMLGGPAILGLTRITLTIARRLNIRRDPRPGFVDLRGRRP